MKFFLSLFIVSFAFSCSPLVRKINDSVRNEVTYLWSMQRNTHSKINKIYRHFKVNVIKRKSTKDYVQFNIYSSFPITQPDFFDTTYIVLSNQNISYPLENILENIHYKEKVDIITTTTKTKTDVKVENSTSIEPVKNNLTENKSLEKTTDTKTTTSTTTDTGTSVNSEILDKIKSERQIQVKVSDLKNALQSTSFKIRIYAQNDNDFWDISFTRKDIKKMSQLIQNIADANE